MVVGLDRVQAGSIEYCRPVHGKEESVLTSLSFIGLIMALRGGKEFGFGHSLQS